jgi:copper chaperone
MLKFLVKNQIRSGEVGTLEQAIKSVDGDAKVDVDIDANTVGVDSWLFPEEFVVAFVEENYDVKIVEW